MDLYDIVKAKCRLEHTWKSTRGEGDLHEVVEAGTTGTIVMVHDERVGYKLKRGEALHFEVEFTDDDSNTLAVMTVSEDDLELVEAYEPTANNPPITPAQIEEIKRKVRMLEEKDKASSKDS